METETPSVAARARVRGCSAVLGVALVALVGVPDVARATAVGRAAAGGVKRRARPQAGGEASIPAELKVRLEALQAKRPDPGERRAESVPVPAAAGAAAAAAAKPVPPPPPVGRRRRRRRRRIPPIPLKFMGTVERPGLKLAALTDCKGFTYAAREGEDDRRPIPARQDRRRIGRHRIFQRHRPDHRPKERRVSARIAELAASAAS